MQKIDYQNKWAYIVGGSQGIGFAIATEFLKRKSNVLLIARNAEKLNKAVTQLKDQFSTAHIRILVADASDETLLKQSFERLSTQEKIRPYFLINCAGGARPHYFEDITTEQLNETFRLNIVSAWSAVKAALPYLKQTGGYIINTSSLAGILGVFGYTDYSMTKFGLIGFSEALRSELERYNIKVSVLCPPDTNTPGFEIENQTKPPETIAVSKNAKLMTAEHVAKNTLKQFEKGKFLLLVNLESKFIELAKRLIPNIAYKIMQIDVRKAQKKL